MEDTSAAVFWRERNAPAEWGGYNDLAVGASVRRGKFATFGDPPRQSCHREKCLIICSVMPTGILWKINRYALTLTERLLAMMIFVHGLRGRREDNWKTRTRLPNRPGTATR